MNETETSVRPTHGIQEPESGKAASVPVDELRERVVKYFTGKLEPGQNPEAIADDLVQAIASAEATGKRKRPKLKASARERHKVLSGAREVSDATPVDRFTRQRAVRMLREALALHQPVVKKCVAERLCNHKSFQQLAEELNLSVDEVKDILAKLRGWVHKFTTYFENDWYWVETGKNYFLPQH
jgi:hypothetical protein